MPAMTKPLVVAFLSLVAAGCATQLDIQGHRGARGLAPENTLAAFERAIDLGVTTVELDVAVTRDGVVVISHDATLNPDITRGPDGRFLTARGPAIRELTYDELLRYDVGRLNPDRKYASSFPEQRASDGERIPKLAELFALARRKNDRGVRFNVEIKSDPTRPELSLAPEPFARVVLDEIRRAGMLERVTIQSFDWRPLEVVQRLEPGVPTSYLTVRAGGFDTICPSAPGRHDVPPAECRPSSWTGKVQYRDYGSVPKMVKAAGGSIWSPRHQDVDEAVVKEAHALGLRVIPWTVNDAAVITKMLALGVDGIISDRPDIVMTLARDRASR
jgi:glycerophosphoryl diester phosphodiesterase